MTKLVPFLRFPEFKDSGEWVEKKLGEIGVSYNGLTGKTSEDFGEGFPYIQYKQIFDKSKIDVGKFGHVSISEGDNQNKVMKGDVFFTISSETPNEVGLSSVLLEQIDNLYLNSFCFGFRPETNDLISNFAQFLFRSQDFRKVVIKLAQGSTRYNISKTEFMKLIVTLPTVEEQTKIATFLTSIDERIEALTEQLELTRDYKKGMMQRIFSQEYRFKDDEGNEYPEWVEKKLGEVGKFSAGGDLTKLNFSKEESALYCYPVYANSAGEGLYGYATTFQYEANCVTVSGRGNLGYAKARTQKFNAIVRLIVIEPKDQTSSKYLEEIINNINFSVESTGVPQLTIPKITSYDAFFPSLPEQTKIASFLSLIDNRIEALSEQLEKTKLFKKAMLQRVLV